MFSRQNLFEKLFDELYFRIFLIISSFLSKRDNFFHTTMHSFSTTKCLLNRGRGTGEAGEAHAPPEFRGFTTKKFLAS